MIPVFWGMGILALSGALADPLEKCQPRNVSYTVGDSKQCDKFWECNKAGKFTERLCDDGFVYAIKISHCDYPHNVDCGERSELQPSQSTNPLCARSNGFYAFPPEVSCQKFYHCLQGEAYEKTCPEGIIFDGKGTCVHPDLNIRDECSASKVLNFTCPNAGHKFAKLKFGNHDRHPHPSDCRKFFVCMLDGNPRVGGCPLGKVFNPKVGVCDHPKRVPSCVDYYGKKAPLKQDESKEGLEDESDSEDEDDQKVERDATPSPQLPKSSNKYNKSSKAKSPVKQAEDDL